MESGNIAEFDDHSSESDRVVEFDAFFILVHLCFLNSFHFGVVGWGEGEGGGCCICPRLHTETTRCRPGSASSFSSSPTMSSHVPIEQQNSDRASQQPAVAAAATPDLPAAAQGPGGGRSPSTPRSQAELAAAAAAAPEAPLSAAPASSVSSAAVVGAPSLASQYGQHPAVSLARTGLEDAMQSLRESNNMLNFYRQQVIQAAQEKPQDPAKVAQAEAKVAQAKAEVALAEAKVALAEAKVALAEAKAAQAKVEADLEKSRAPGSAEHDQLSFRERAFQRATEEVDLAKRKVGAAESRVALADAKVALAEAKVALADANVNFEQLHGLERTREAIEAAENEVRSRAENVARLNNRSGLQAVARAPVPGFEDDADATAFVTALMRTEPVELEAGVQRWNLACNPLFSGQQVDIFLRRDTFSFWEQVSSTLRERTDREWPNNVVAMGSPGIGKSATVPYLIRLLLQQGKTVVFQERVSSVRSNLFLFCATPDGDYQGRRCATSNLSDIDQLQETHGTVLVVEPAQHRYPPSVHEIRCPFVLVCSPSKSHYGSLGKGADHGRAEFLYYPMWTLDELQAVRPCLSVEGRPLATEQVEMRYFMFGGCARNVFASSAEVRNAMAAQTLGVRRLSSEVSARVLMGSDDAISEEANESAGHPSTVVCYMTKSPYSVAERRTFFISQLVRANVWYLHLSIMWWRHFNGAATHAEAGYAFERYCYEILCAPATFVVRRIAGNLGSTLAEISTTSRSRSEVSSPESSASRSSPGSGLFTPAVSNYRLIDAADRDVGNEFRAYQCTVSKEHSCDATQVDDMLAAFGVPAAVMRTAARRAANAIVNGRVVEGAREAARTAREAGGEANAAAFALLKPIAQDAALAHFPLLDSSLHDGLVAGARNAAEAAARAGADILVDGDRNPTVPSIMAEIMRRGGMSFVPNDAIVRPIVRLFFMVPMPQATAFRLTAEAVRNLPAEVELYVLSVPQPRTSPPGPQVSDFLESYVKWLGGSEDASALKRPRRD